MRVSADQLRGSAAHCALLRSAAVGNGLGNLVPFPKNKAHSLDFRVRSMLKACVPACTFL